jgi:hypothetical protein
VISRSQLEWRKGFGVCGDHNIGTLLARLNFDKLGTEDATVWGPPPCPPC